LQVAAADTLGKQGIEVITNASVTKVEADAVSCQEQTGYGWLAILTG